MKLNLDSYLEQLQEGAPAIIGTSIAAVMGLSALTNVYIAYKERVREYGRNLQECKEKCELRYNENEAHPDYYTEEDKRKLIQSKQDCINRCTARYYQNIEISKKKQDEIKELIKDRIKKGKNP